MRYYTCHRTLFLFWLRRQMRFQIVCLSIVSMPTLCLKDPLIEKDIIHPELLLVVGVIRWNKVDWVLETQKQGELFINN